MCATQILSARCSCKIAFRPDVPICEGKIAQLMTKSIYMMHMERKLYLMATKLH